MQDKAEVADEVADEPRDLPLRGTAWHAGTMHACVRARALGLILIPPPEQYASSLFRSPVPQFPIQSPRHRHVSDGGHAKPPLSLQMVPWYQGSRGGRAGKHHLLAPSWVPSWVLRADGGRQCAAPEASASIKSAAARTACMYLSRGQVPFVACHGASSALRALNFAAV